MRSNDWEFERYSQTQLGHSPRVLEGQKKVLRRSGPFKWTQSSEDKNGGGSCEGMTGILTEQCDKDRETELSHYSRVLEGQSHVSGHQSSGGKNGGGKKWWRGKNWEFERIVV